MLNRGIFISTNKALSAKTKADRPIKLLSLLPLRQSDLNLTAFMKECEMEGTRKGGGGVAVACVWGLLMSVGVGIHVCGRWGVCMSIPPGECVHMDSADH